MNLFLIALATLPVTAILLLDAGVTRERVLSIKPEVAEYEDAALERPWASPIARAQDNAQAPTWRRESSLRDFDQPEVDLCQPASYKFKP